MRLGLDIDEKDLADAICDSFGDEALQLLLTVDLQMADVGFTESLVKGLLKSVRSDYATPEDWQQFIAEISEIKP